MGVVTNNSILARRRQGECEIGQLVRERERTCQETVERRARIQAATRDGRAALRARSQAEQRLVIALNKLLLEELSLREAADRIGVSYHQARQLLRPSGDVKRCPEPE